MLITKKDLIIVFSMLFILISMPFNFLYNYFLVTGVIPSIPGFGYAIINHIFALIVFCFFIFNFKLFFILKKCFFVFIFFSIYVFLFSFLNLTYFHYAGDFGVFIESFVFLIYFCCFFVSFSFYYNINKNIFRNIFLLMFFIAIFEMNFSNIIPFSFDNIAGKTEGHISYQLVSFFMLITWVMFFFKEESFINRIIFSFLILFLLLISGGRSELIGFVVAGIVTLLAYFIFSTTQKHKKYIFMFLGGSSIIYLSIYLISKYANLFESSRHTQILDFENSSSWQEREYLYRMNVQKIIDNPILGSYGSHKELGDGAYIHNALSAWQQFGIVGFILYLILIFIPILLAIYYLFKDKDRYNIYPFLFISIYVAILCIATKPIFWPYASISLGLLFAYMKNRKEIF